MTPPLTYRLEGAIAPKARPRFNGKNAYLPNNYRQWRNDAELQLIAQGIPITPIEKACVEIVLTGKHSRRSDADNVAGSILDCLVSVGVFQNDNLNSIPKMSIELQYSKESPIALITIKD